MIHHINIRDARSASALFDRAASLLLRSPVRQRSVVRLPARGQLLVTGDLHDNDAHLKAIVRMARLRRADHHVILHELIHGDTLVNGLDFSHQMLAKVAELVVAHPGRVHPLLANHEVAQMTGKEVSKGAGRRVSLFNEALQFVFGADWATVRDAIGRFVAAMPLALTSDSGLMCSHSLPSAKVMRRFDTGILERDLRPYDYIGPGGSAYEMVWGRNYTAETARTLAERWGVKLFCVGHEHAPEGCRLRFANVVVLNSDHAQGAALPIDLADVPRGFEAVRLAQPLARTATLA